MLLISAINFLPRTKHTGFTPKHISFFPPRFQIHFLSRQMHSVALNRCENSGHCTKKSENPHALVGTYNLFVGKRNIRQRFYFLSFPDIVVSDIYFLSPFHLYLRLQFYLFVLVFYYKEIPLN
jgi:hypothetical protein